MASIENVEERTKDGLTVVLNSPVAGDGAALLKCVKEIMASSRHLLTTPEEFSFTAEKEEEFICSTLAHPDKLIITPRVNGEIVGMLDFHPGHRKRIAHQGEFGMSVHPNFQGKGIGEMLLKALIHWARSNPRIETLRLRVFAGNTAALALYHKCGFEIEGRELRGAKFADGTYDDMIVMALPLK